MSNVGQKGANERYMGVTLAVCGSHRRHNPECEKCVAIEKTSYWDRVKQLSSEDKRA